MPDGCWLYSTRAATTCFQYSLGLEAASLTEQYEFSSSHSHADGRFYAFFSLLGNSQFYLRVSFIVHNRLQQLIPGNYSRLLTYIACVRLFVYSLFFWHLTLCRFPWWIESNKYVTISLEFGTRLSILIRTMCILWKMKFIWVKSNML